MPDLVSKPAHRIENADAHFEQLLDTDEAAALLKIHPKTLQQMEKAIAKGVKERRDRGRY